MDNCDNRRGVTLRIINKSNNPIPAYSTIDAAGLDLSAYLPNGNVTLAPLGRVLIPTGIYIELPHGYEAQIRPRSGLALKLGLSVLNSPGTIDADYRGEVGVILINLSSEAVEIKSGDRIAQMVVVPYSRAELVEVETLSTSERGSGGFGHTGV